jgi:hypothetical protein
MKFYPDNMTRRFLRQISDKTLNESKNPDIYSYIQTLGEILDNLRPKSISERRRLDVAKQQVKEIRRHARRLRERITLLEEQVHILEETKEK